MLLLPRCSKANEATCLEQRLQLISPQAWIRSCYASKPMPYHGAQSRNSLLQPYKSKKDLWFWVRSLRKHGNVVVLAMTMSIEYSCNISLMWAWGYRGHPGKEGWCLNVGCLRKYSHLGVSSAVCTTWFQNELNPPLGWFIQLVKKQLDQKDYKHGRAGCLALKILGGKGRGKGFLCCVAKPQRKCSSVCLNVKHVIKHFAESKLKSLLEARIVSIFLSLHNRLIHSCVLSNFNRFLLGVSVLQLLGILKCLYASNDVIMEYISTQLTF